MPSKSASTILLLYDQGFLPCEIIKKQTRMHSILVPDFCPFTIKIFCLAEIKKQHTRRHSILVPDFWSFTIKISCLAKRIFTDEQIMLKKIYYSISYRSKLPKTLTMGNQKNIVAPLRPRFFALQKIKKQTRRPSILVPEYCSCTTKIFFLAK